MTDNDWQNIGKIVKFRIYYGDKTEVEGEGDSMLDVWKNSSKENVQILFLKDDKGDKFRNNGQDLYALDSEMELRILSRDPEIKRGKLLPDSEFHPLFDKAKKEFEDF